jgi:hypothetical protein
MMKGLIISYSSFFLLKFLGVWGITIVIYDYENNSISEIDSGL